MILKWSVMMYSLSFSLVPKPIHLAKVVLCVGPVYMSGVETGLRFLYVAKRIQSVNYILLMNCN